MIAATSGAGIGLVLMATPLTVGVATAAQQRDPYFGMHIHRADQENHWPSVPFGAWRLWDASVGWLQVQPARDRWDFSRLDRYVIQAGQAGVDILFPFGLTPGWASARPSERSAYSPGNAAEPADIEDWRRYVRTVATRYKGLIQNYEIWNEVNVPTFFSGSSEKLVELTCEARRVLKQVSPLNRLVSPSMVGVGKNLEQFEAFLSAGGRNCIDVVGYHFYVPHREPEELLDLVTKVREIMARQGIGDMPLWNTEAGWWIENADGSDQSSADTRWRRVRTSESAGVVARTLLVGKAAGLERFYWYAWDSSFLGLIEPGTNKLKPGGVALGIVIRWLEQGRELHCSRGGTVWRCKVMQSGGKPIGTIVWNGGPGSHTISLDKSEQPKVVEYLDGAVRAVTDSASVRSWSVGAEPVFLRTIREEDRPKTGNPPR